MLKQNAEVAMYDRFRESCGAGGEQYPERMIARDILIAKALGGRRLFLNQRRPAQNRSPKVWQGLRYLKIVQPDYCFDTLQRADYGFNLLGPAEILPP